MPKLAQRTRNKRLCGHDLIQKIKIGTNVYVGIGNVSERHWTGRKDENWGIEPSGAKRQQKKNSRQLGRTRVSSIAPQSHGEGNSAQDAYANCSSQAGVVIPVQEVRKRVAPPKGSKGSSCQPSKRDWPKTCLWKAKPCTLLLPGPRLNTSPLA